MSRVSKLHYLIFLIIPIFFLTSCASLRYGRPYNETSKTINVTDLQFNQDVISAKLFINEKVFEKVNEKWATEAETVGTGHAVIRTVLGVALYPLVLVWEMINISKGKKHTRDDHAMLLAPLGSAFWYPNMKNPFDKTKILKVVKEHQQPVKNGIITINDFNHKHNWGATTTDTNGKFHITSNKFLQINDEKIELDLSYQGINTSVNVDLVAYFKSCFGKSIVLSEQERNSYLKYAKHHPKLFFDLKPKGRIYLIENLPYEESGDPWKLLSAITNNSMDNYLNPTISKTNKIPEPPVKPVSPPLIIDPQLPPVIEIEQRPFENLAMFSKRMEKAKTKRKQQINEIIQNYKMMVEKRNDNIIWLKQNYEKAYKQYLANIKIYNINKKRNINYYNKVVTKRRVHTSTKEKEFLLENFNKVFGEPKLTNLTFPDGTPKYYPEKKIMIARLYYGDRSKPLLKQDISISSVQPGDNTAGKLYDDLKHDFVNPSVSLSYNNNQFGIEKVKINQYSSILWGRPTFDKLQKNKSQKVLLGYKDSTLPESLNKKYSAKALVIDDVQEPEILELQSAYVKDVEFETFISNELKKFNDDIPALLKKKNKKTKDNTKWLFAIGIEDYTKTNRINFSKRSAEMFADVAMKTLGIPEGNTFLLVDNGKKSLSNLNKNRIYENTAGSIKDQIRYLKRDIKKGDKIYFYYSGHGIPSINDNKKPYILAKDQAPDFIHMEKFFRVDEIYKTLSQSRAGEIIVFMDSCFTGETDGSSVFQGSKAATRLIQKEIDFDNKKMAVLCAGTSNQFSNMYKEKGHRMFSYYLMKSLLKSKESSTIGSLSNKVRANTSSTSRKLGGSNLQEPTLKGNTKINIF